MFISVSQLLVVLTASYFVSAVYVLLRNYLKVRSSGFTIFISPIDPATPLWRLASVPLSPLISRYFPARLARVLSLATYGNEFRDRLAHRFRPTPGWMLVAPGGKNELWVEDPEIMNYVLSKRRAFPQDFLTRGIVGALGPNLMSVGDDDWQRMRRIIAPALNERIMDNVWSESCDQTAEMMVHFAAEFDGQTDRSVEGLRRIAFNVLQRAGYGTHEGWKEISHGPPAGHEMEYMQALHELVGGLAPLAIFPRKLLLSKWVPKFIQRIGTAYKEFNIFTRELLQKERQSGNSTDSPHNSILSTFASFSDNSATTKGNIKPSAQSLSEEEVTGSLFQFTLAGYDTTANTLAYALANLVISPEWQDWIIEEIDAIQSSGAASSYREVFPRLKRCLALMYETLRNYTPVAHVIRECEDDHVVTSGGKTYHIPAGTRINICLDGMHSHKIYWGDDVFDFRPSRWLDSRPSPLLTDSHSMPPKESSSVNAPTLDPPNVQGTFVPWSAGPRICPGMKMAQVEFLAVIWTIFREYRVEVVPMGREDMQAARRRIEKCIEDSMPLLTLQMKRPRDIVLKWTKRAE